MAHIEEDLRSYLLANAGVSAITSRVYYNYVPQDAVYPLIVLTTINNLELQDMSGLAGVRYPRVQVVAWAKTYTGAKDLTAAIHAAFQAHNAAINAGNAAKWGHATTGSQVRACLFEDEDDLPDPSPDLEEDRVYAVRQDWIIWHE